MMLMLTLVMTMMMLIMRRRRITCIMTRFRLLYSSDLIFRNYGVGITFSINLKLID